MGWEKRGNHEYYYQKIRTNNSVRSVYIGRGEFAYLIAKLDKKKRKEKILERLKTEMENEHFQVLDNSLQEITETNAFLVDALFLINGYHQHNRQWRKKRNATKK